MLGVEIWGHIECEEPDSDGQAELRGRIRNQTGYLVSLFGIMLDIVPFAGLIVRSGGWVVSRCHQNS